jgi:4-amino-4-deoxy-L-arabinose transferase-like glycosyltransferase
MSPTRRWLTWLGISFFVLWLFFVLGSFFTVQKPFDATHAEAIARNLMDLLVAGWVAFAATGLGMWLLARLLRDPLPVMETVVLGAGLGLGALALISLGFGFLHLFQPAPVFIATVLLSALSGWQLWRLQWQPLPTTSTPASASLPHWLVGAYLAAFVLLSLLPALLPATDFDGLFYHLVAPKLYLQAGGIVGGIDIFPVNIPALIEMLFAWTMLLRGDIAAKLLHALFGLLTGGLLFVAASRLLGRAAAWLALLIYASMPMVHTLAGWAYSDLALAFFQLAGLYALIRYILPAPVASTEPTAPDRGWLILAALFSGLAMGVKYTSFVMPLGLGLLLYGAAIVRGRWRQGIWDLLGFGLLAGLVGFPWYLKNWVLIGNPVYPFLYSWFGGEFWSEFRAEWYSAAGTGIGWDPGTLLALPWLVTLGVNDASYWDGRLGPLFLLFMPVLLFFAVIGRRYERQWQVTYYSFAGYALFLFFFWVLGVTWSQPLWQSRHLLPGLVVLSPLVGWAWANLSRYDRPNFALSRFVNLALALTLALTLVDIGLLTLKTDPVPYIVGLESRDRYLTRRLGAHYQAMKEINTLPAAAVVQFMWEPRSYYCNRDCRPDASLDVLAWAIHQHGTAANIAAAWQDAGITHVLIHQAGLHYFLNELPDAVNQPVLTELQTNHLELLVDVAGVYQLYKVRGSP